METFGRRLKQERISLGLSNLVFSHRVGIDKSTVTRLENGTRRPSFGMVVKLADALNLPEGSAGRDKLFLSAGYVPEGIDPDRLVLTCQVARRAAR